SRQSAVSSPGGTAPRATAFCLLPSAFCLLALPALRGALSDGAPWWVVVPPVVQTAAQVATVAAISSWASRRARSTAGALALGHSLALLAPLAMALVVAAL